MIEVLSHREADVHEGRCFCIGLENSALAKDGTINIAIKTPKTGHVEVFGEYQAFGGNVKIEFLQGATVSDGTTYTPINQNDQSAKTSKCTVLTGVTVSVDGTTKRERTLFSSSTVPAKSDSFVADPIPRILKKDTQYVLRMTSLETTVSVGAYISMAEHV